MEHCHYLPVHLVSVRPSNTVLVQQEQEGAPTKLCIILFAFCSVQARSAHPPPPQKKKNQGVYSCRWDGTVGPRGRHATFEGRHFTFWGRHSTFGERFLLPDGSLMTEEGGMPPSEGGFFPFEGGIPPSKSDILPSEGGTTTIVGCIVC